MIYRKPAIPTQSSPTDFPIESTGHFAMYQLRTKPKTVAISG